MLSAIGSQFVSGCRACDDSKEPKPPFLILLAVQVSGAESSGLPNYTCCDVAMLVRVAQQSVHVMSYFSALNEK